MSDGEAASRHTTSKAGFHDVYFANMYASFLRPFDLGGCPVVATDHRSTLITTERIDRQADKEHDRHECIIAYHEPEEGAPKKTPSIHSQISTASFYQPLPLRKLVDFLNSTSGRAWSKVNGSIFQALSLAVARKPVKNTDFTKTNNEHRFFPKAEPLVVLDGGLVALQGKCESNRFAPLRQRQSQNGNILPRRQRRIASRPYERVQQDVSSNGAATSFF